MHPFHPSYTLLLNGALLSSELRRLESRISRGKPNPCSLDSKPKPSERSCNTQSLVPWFSQLSIPLESLGDVSVNILLTFVRSHTKVFCSIKCYRPGLEGSLLQRTISLVMLTEINLVIKIKYPSKLLKLFSITELFPFKLIIPQSKEKAAIRHKTEILGLQFRTSSSAQPSFIGVLQRTEKDMSSLEYL